MQWPARRLFPLLPFVVVCVLFWSLASAVASPLPLLLLAPPHLPNFFFFLFFFLFRLCLHLLLRRLAAFFDKGIIPCYHCICFTVVVISFVVADPIISGKYGHMYIHMYIHMHHTHPRTSAHTQITPY